MEPLLKSQFSKLRLIFIGTMQQRTVTILLLFLLGLIFVLGIQELLVKRAIARSHPLELICSTKPNFLPEELSRNGRMSYDRGQFDAARDCWKKSTDAYRKVKNEPEAINNQINQAQAEQALGFYPKACNTLLQIYSNQNCTTLLENPQQLQSEKGKN